jgi:putative transposase
MKKPKDLIDELLAGCKTPADIAGENGLLKQLTKAIIERAMQAELTTHLGYEKHSVDGHKYGEQPKREQRQAAERRLWDA